ncbi:FHA/TonB domain protein [Plesiocystis pacifica SIR-1]|uniref:FHA/TonB domain protein n=1 Tax=Plesiocystis pacifica SIR-1 TaxID=391625 RepID=A6GHJ0_9BACT|nr:AgmX/PglI C-terminal domain-containing protein [Plesiocystis pacifica]EDM74663.1 FHA/TonB domain protein [Plesiocystis pacifica SIR-1]
MATKTIRFRIFLNDQLVDTREFTQEVIKLGRLGSSHLRLEDDAIGRMHAVVEVGPEGDVRLIDLGSAAGTIVNGEAIDRSRALASGDVIQLGSYRLETAIVAPVAKAPAAPADRPAAPVAAAAPRTTAPAPRTAVDLSQVEDANEQVAEVVTTFGRSVLDVSHVGQAKSRKRSAVPLMALGGALMAGGLGLFAYEVAQPWEAYNAQVVEAAQRHAEAPAAPGLGTGSLGMMLGLLGLVPFVAGSMRMREETLEVFSIGESPDASFKLSGTDLPNPGSTPLVHRDSTGGYALSFTPGMEGNVELGRQLLSLHDLVETGRTQAGNGVQVYPLPKGARAKVRHGDIAFSVNLVNRGAVVAGRGETDWPFWAYFGGTAAIATSFYLLMRSMPDDALAMQLEDENAANRFASYFHQADEEPEAPEPDEQEPQPEAKDSAGGETGKRAKGPEGKMGKDSAKATNKAYAMSGPSKSVPQMARTFDPDRAARSAGILGLMAEQQGHFLAHVDGGAFAVGTDDQDMWGNIVGTEVGEAYGTGGLGLIGSGHSGGGSADGLIGMGTTGLIGHGTGTGGTGFGPGEGGGALTKFGDKRKPVIQARVGKGKVVGAIDKDTIRRIVRSHLMEVRGCYNAALSRNPNTEGRVLVQFAILGTGKVGSAVVQENTTKDKAVGDCIAKAVKRWKFPRTRNGGTAMVSYPFRLSSK